MNVAIIKFGQTAREFVKRNSPEYNIISVADPATSNLVMCDFICPKADKSFDYSESIARKDVEAVFVTILDEAYGIMLTALAYGKNVMVDSSVKYNNSLELLSRKLGLWIDWAAT